MKILVMWERGDERDYAENLADVLGTSAANLAANARVRGGSVEISYNAVQLPKVLVRACPVDEIYEMRRVRNFGGEVIKAIATRSGVIQPGSAADPFAEPQEPPPPMKPPNDIRELDL